jgi:chemotaxis signal transduction protein
MSLRASMSSAADLRQAFDSSFAAPPAAAAPEHVDFVVISVGANSYAVSMEEIGGLHTDLAVTACPGPFAEFMGLCTFRSVLTPVYDLAALMGDPITTGRWLIVAKSGEAAFAFAAYEMHLRIERGSIASRPAGNAGRCISGVVDHADRALPIISIPSLIAVLGERIASRPLPKGVSEHA